jgi:hypothetical protein
MIIAWETFYSAEGVASVIVSTFILQRVVHYHKPVIGNDKAYFPG